jgi:sugar lactone lactonase YvrE
MMSILAPLVSKDVVSNIISQYASPSGVLCEQWELSWMWWSSLPKGEMGTAIAVGQNGLVYITDCDNHRIIVFGVDGRTKHAWGYLGEGPGLFRFPGGIDSADDGRKILVADQLNQRIQVFTNEGVFVCEWGRGYLSYPNTVVWDQCKRRVFVIDNRYCRISFWTEDGHSLGELTERRHGFGELMLGDLSVSGSHGIATDSKGLIYVVDTCNGCVRVYTSMGARIQEWWCFGAKNLRLINDILYVTHSPKGVEMYTTEGKHIGQMCQEAYCDLGVTNTHAYLLSSKDRLVRVVC